MMWFSIFGIFVSFLEVWLGIGGFFLIELNGLKQLIDLRCESGIMNKESVWEAHGTLGELYITAHIVVIMIYFTIYYIVFLVIPWKFDRVIKTPKEVIILLSIFIRSKKRKKSRKN